MHKFGSCVHIFTLGHLKYAVMDFIALVVQLGLSEIIVVRYFIDPLRGNVFFCLQRSKVRVSHTPTYCVWGAVHFHLLRLSAEYQRIDSCMYVFQRWSLSERCVARFKCVFFFFSPQSKTSSPLPPTKPASLIVCYFSLFLHLTYIHLFVAEAALEMNPLSLCVCYEKKLGWTDESEEHECPCNTARWRAWRRRTA